MKTFSHKTAVLGTCAALLGATALPAAADALYFDFNRNQVSSSATASLFLFGTAGQTATVSNLAGFNQTVTLGSDGFFNLAINNTYQQSGTGILNTGFRVDSGSAIAGYFINRAPFTTDMTYLLNASALDKNYVVASMGSGFGEGSQVAIHATVNNTQVTFTPKGGTAINVTLNAGQTYKYAGGTADLTGSFISASQNVAVFSGNECANVPVGTVACDTLLEQAIPTSKLSKTYITAASGGANQTSTNSDLMRVIATVDGTQVKRDGVVVATLAAGSFYEFLLPKGTGTKIDASQPVALAQYLTGAGSSGSALTDPALTYVPGSDTLLSSYKLATPSGGAAFVQNYADVVVDAADLTTLALNGILVDTSSFYSIGSTGFFGGLVNLPIGVFTLSATDPFLVLLGGGSSFDSYFTYGGSSFAPGVSPPANPPTPGVPEPSTVALFGIALAGLALGRRGKRDNA